MSFIVALGVLGLAAVIAVNYGCIELAAVSVAFFLFFLFVELVRLLDNFDIFEAGAPSPRHSAYKVHDYRFQGPSKPPEPPPPSALSQWCGSVKSALFPEKPRITPQVLRAYQEALRQWQGRYLKVQNRLQSSLNSVGIEAAYEHEGIIKLFEESQELERKMPHLEDFS